MARLLPNGRPSGPMSQSRLALAKNIRENAFANREFSSPAPTKATSINANLRGANFIRPQDAEIAREVIDWDNLVAGKNDPIGTIKGAAEVASLGSPLANAYRLAKYIKDGDLSVTGADMQDVNQAIAYSQFIPMGKFANMGARFGIKAAEKAGLATMAAGRRLGPEGFNATTKGIYNVGRPVRAARRKPPQSEEYVKDVFDIEHPLEDKAFVEGFEQRTPISELSPEDAKTLGQVDELVNRTKQKAREQGIKTKDVSAWLRTYSHALSPKDKNALFRLYEPTDVGMEFRVSTKSRPNIDEIKQAMHRTMLGGAERQKAYGQIPEMPYKNWQDIPDEQANNIIDQIVGNWKIFDAEGRLVTGDSVQLDHIVDLILGGKNTELQPMRGRANAGKGARAKEEAKKNK